MKIGFPDFVRYNSLSGQLTDIRRDLSESSTELVSGRKQNLGRELGATSGDYNLVAKALADTDTSIDRLTLANNRLSAAAIPLNQVRSQLTDFSADAYGLLVSDGFVNQTLEADARSEVRQIFTSLNTSYAGRNLFSGDTVESTATVTADEFFAAIDTAIGGATDAADLDTAITAFFAPGGDFDTQIYQGGAGNASDVQLPTGGAISYDVKADDEAFRGALEGLIRVAYAPEDGKIDFARDGVDKIKAAETRMIALEADVGRQQSRVDTSIEALGQEKLILAETENNFAGVDAFEAANRVQTLELQLQAAYTMTARISRLTLTNFL